MYSRVRLGRSPVDVAPLGVGCWAWGDKRYWRYEQAYGPRDVIAAFEASVAAGCDLFDTAEVYGWGKSERIIGALVQRTGANAVIATKYAPLRGRGGARAIRKGLTGSLRRLGLPRVDLYQLHWADSDELAIDAAMSTLAEIVHAGQARAVGVSNFRAAEMRRAHAALAVHGVPLASNQVHYSLLHRSPEVDGVLDACRELEVTLLAYSPLEQGLLTGKYDGASLPIDARAEATWFSAANVVAAQAVVAALRAIGERHEAEPAAVALAWLLAKPGVVPLVGVKNAQQARANARALAIRLTGDEIAELDTVSHRWRDAG